MFTLLPEDYKKEMIKRYRRRVFIVGLIGLCSILLFSVLLQFSIYVNTKTKYDNLVIELHTLESLVKKDGVSAIGIDTKNLTFDLDILSSTTPSILPIINIPSRYLVPGITVIKIEYSVLDQDHFSLLINGLANTRNDLSLFSKNLKKEKNFLEVDLPVENLAKDRDIAFNIKIKGQYE